VQRKRLGVVVVFNHPDPGPSDPLITTT